MSDVNAPSAVLLLSLLALNLVPCGAQQGMEAEYVTVRDSAGVPLMVLDWDRAVSKADTVDLRAPALQVGQLGGTYEFQNIIGVLPLSGNRLAVADLGGFLVSIFDEAGSRITTMGGVGGGPGELQQLMSLTAYGGDSILIHDARSNRLTVFPVRGGEPRTMRPCAEHLGNLPRVQGAFPDGTVLLSRAVQGQYTGLRRPTEIAVCSPTGELMHRLGRLPGATMFGRNADGAAAAVQPPFPEKFFAAVSSDRAILVDGAIAAYDARTKDAERAGSWRSTAARSPTTPQRLRAYRDALLDGIPPETGRLYIETVNQAPDPDSLPHFTGMMADPDGRVWLRRDHFGDPSELWAVIGVSGSLDYFVRAPPRVRLLSVTRKLAFGVAKDELDVQSVVVYDLVR